MAQRKRNERPASAKPGGLDEDGYEYPGPHADVLFVLQSGPDIKRRRRFWMRLVGRGQAGAGAAETGLVRPAAPSEPEAGTATL
jgi:hypothetical protein